MHVSTIRRAGALSVLMFLAAACSSSNPPAASSGSPVPAAARVLPVVALPGYSVSVFTFPTSVESATPPFGPDSIALDQGHVFIDYQNTTAKDCSDLPTAKSTVDEYDMNGKFMHSWQILGHSDGMRIDPTTHLIWTTSCEDGNPQFQVIDPVANTVTPYKLAVPHGGGYDDLYFLGGKAYISASSPSLDANGNNLFPAIDQIALSGGKAVLTPILMGNAMATDTTTKTQARLVLTDPDSLSTNTSGDLILVSQADSLYVTISSPGTPNQKVTKTSVGDQLDDTVWSTGPGRLLVTDGTTSKTYWIDGSWPAGTIITQAPNDSGVTNFLATVDPATGYVTPFAIGFGKATGMIFVPST